MIAVFIYEYRGKSRQLKVGWSPQGDTRKR